LLSDLTSTLLTDPGFLLLAVLLVYTFVIEPPTMVSLFSFVVYKAFNNAEIDKINKKFALKVND